MYDLQHAGHTAVEQPPEAWGLHCVAPGAGDAEHAYLVWNVNVYVQASAAVVPDVTFFNFNSSAASQYRKYTALRTYRCPVFGSKAHSNGLEGGACVPSTSSLNPSFGMAGSMNDHCMPLPNCAMGSQGAVQHTVVLEPSGLTHDWFGSDRLHGGVSPNDTMTAPNDTGGAHRGRHRAVTLRHTAAEYMWPTVSFSTASGSAAVGTGWG